MTRTFVAYPVSDERVTSPVNLAFQVDKAYSTLTTVDAWMTAFNILLNSSNLRFCFFILSKTSIFLSEPHGCRQNHPWPCSFPHWCYCVALSRSLEMLGSFVRTQLHIWSFLRFLFMEIRQGLGKSWIPPVSMILWGASGPISQG